MICKLGIEWTIRICISILFVFMKALTGRPRFIMRLIELYFRSPTGET